MNKSIEQVRKNNLNNLNKLYAKREKFIGQKVLDGVTIKKVRKPRGLKLDGRMSYDMCDCCISYGCDPMAHGNPFFIAKKAKRSEQGLCRSCGKNPCGCKSVRAEKVIK